MLIFLTEILNSNESLYQVIGNAVRQLQQIATDDTCQDCMELFNNERKTGGRKLIFVYLHFNCMTSKEIEGKISAILFFKRNIPFLDFYLSMIRISFLKV